MSEDENYVECPEHGIQQTTYVCQHVVQSIRDGIPRGFWCSAESPDNPRPDAWCSECEVRVSEAGEWNEETEAFAGVNLLCGACYDKAKELKHGKNIK
jgi:hypothetical protein